MNDILENAFQDADEIVNLVKTNNMDAATEMRESVKKKIDTADIHTLEQIADLLEFGDADPLMNMPKEQEASLLRGIQDANEGRVTPHEEVMKQYKQWLTK